MMDTVERYLLDRMRDAGMQDEVAKIERVRALLGPHFASVCVTLLKIREKA